MKVHRGQTFLASHYQTSLTEQPLLQGPRVIDWSVRCRQFGVEYEIQFKCWLTLDGRAHSFIAVFRFLPQGRSANEHHQKAMHRGDYLQSVESPSRACANDIHFPLCKRVNQKLLSSFDSLSLSSSSAASSKMYDDTKPFPTLPSNIQHRHVV